MKRFAQYILNCSFNQMFKTVNVKKNSLSVCLMEFLEKQL